MPQLYLLLGVVSFGMLGVLHKVSDHRNCRPEGVNLILFRGAATLFHSKISWGCRPPPRRELAQHELVAAHFTVCRVYNSAEGERSALAGTLI